jgi:hypothetical protein
VLSLQQKHKVSHLLFFAGRHSQCAGHTVWASVIVMADHERQDPEHSSSWIWGLYCPGLTDYKGQAYSC